MKHAAPPRLADALLGLFLPDGVKGLTILGDLHQEFGDRVNQQGRGRARLNYWRDAWALSLRLAPGMLRRRFSTIERGDGLMASFLADLKVGFRMLLKTPALSAIAILTIAMGVGLTTHIWSMVYGSVIRGLPVPDQDRVFTIFQVDLERGNTSDMIPWLDYLDLNRGSSATPLAGYYQGSVNLAGDEAPPERYRGAFVTANALSLLGVAPMLGRTFAPGEDGAGATPRALLSHRVWRDRFGADPAIVGKTVRANSRATEVIGVMPEGFAFPFAEDLWLPIEFDYASVTRQQSYVSVFGRTPEGVSFEAEASALNATAVSIAAANPETNAGLGYRVSHFSQRFMPPQITSVMYLMLVSTFGVLLIACANVANLLLARASMRGSEVAVRTALGASRLRVIRQLLAEALVLAMIGGASGVGVSHLMTSLSNNAIATIEKPYWIQAETDWTAILFALAVTLLAALAAGTWPAVRASGIGFGGILRDSTRGGSSLRMGRFSQVLVVGELAVSCGLLIGAGLMIRSVANLKSVDLGFEADAALVGRMGLFEGDYPEQEDRRAFWQTVETELESMPNVESVALTSQLPGLGGAQWWLSIEGVEYPTPRDHPISNGTITSAGFFSTVGVDFVAGRDFLPIEEWDTELPVAIVNESFVSSFLDGRDPLGSRVRLGREDSGDPFMQIVGVVPDLYVGGEVGGLGNDRISPEHLYVTPGAFDVRFMSAMVRTQGPPAGMAAALRQRSRRSTPTFRSTNLARWMRPSRHRPGHSDCSVPSSPSSDSPLSSWRRWGSTA